MCMLAHTCMGQYMHMGQNMATQDYNIWILIHDVGGGPRKLRTLSFGVFSIAVVILLCGLLYISNCSI